MSCELDMSPLNVPYVHFYILYNKSILDEHFRFCNKVI